MSQNRTNISVYAQAKKMKQLPILILLLFVMVIFMAGCTDKEGLAKEWFEKGEALFNQAMKFDSGDTIAQTGRDAAKKGLNS